MASPVTAEDIAPYLISADSAPCDKAAALVKVLEVLHADLLFRYNADGSLSSDFIALLNDAGVGTGGGGGAGSTNLSAPTGVTATSDRTTDVRVQWVGVATATAYQVYRGTSSDTGSMELVASTSSLLYDDTNAADHVGTVYFYAVKASNSAFISAFSAVTSGRVSAGSDVGTPVDYSGSSTREITVPAGAATMTVELWGSGGAGGIIPDWTGIGTTRLGGGGGASGSYVKVTGVTVTPGDKYILQPGYRGTASAIYKTTLGASEKAFANAGGAGGNGGWAGGLGGTASVSGENNLGSGSVDGTSTGGNDGGAGATGTVGSGGAAVDPGSGKTAGGGAAGSLTSVVNYGSNGRIIVTFST